MPLRPALVRGDNKRLLASPGVFAIVDRTPFVGPGEGREGALVDVAD